MNGPSLQQLQHWLLGVITHPGGIQAGVAASQEQIALAPAELEQVILPSRQQTSSERLAVYGNAYYARLLECLREFFPCLASAIGEETFADFSLAYLQQHPPRSYSLNHLAEHFVSFLQATRPTDAAALDWPDFLIDLARLEQAIEQVFDGPGPEKLRTLVPADLQTIDPSTWLATRLTLIPGLQLLAFRFPVSTYYTAWKHASGERQDLVSGGRQPPDDFPILAIQPQEQFIALFRRDFIVRRCELLPAEYELLQMLAAGATIGEALERAAAQATDLDQLAENLQSWFRSWAGQRLFTAMD